MDLHGFVKDLHGFKCIYMYSSGFTWVYFDLGGISVIQELGCSATCGGKLWPLYTTMLSPWGCQAGRTVAGWMAGWLDGWMAVVGITSVTWHARHLEGSADSKVPLHLIGQWQMKQYALVYLSVLEHRITFWPRFPISRNDLGNWVEVKDMLTLRPAPSPEFRGGSCRDSQIGRRPHIYL